MTTTQQKIDAIKNELAALEKQLQDENEKLLSNQRHPRDIPRSIFGQFLGAFNLTAQEANTICHILSTTYSGLFEFCQTCGLCRFYYRRFEKNGGTNEPEEPVQIVTTSVELWRAKKFACQSEN